MFVPMVDILPERQESENFVLEHFEISPDEAHMATIRDRIYTTPGKYVRLYRKSGFKEVVMSDTVHEQRTNREVVRQARGDVLIAGFGIGMILVPILLKPEVKTVTIIEISEEVPKMVLSYLPNKEKLTVIYADIMEWKPPKGQIWDVIYFDIWDHIGSSNYEQMKTLHRRFGRKKRAWMGSWCEDYCREAYKRERREKKEWDLYFGNRSVEKLIENSKETKKGDILL